MNNAYNTMREYCDGEIEMKSFCNYILHTDCPGTCSLAKGKNIETLAQEREDLKNKTSGRIKGNIK